MNDKHARLAGIRLFENALPEPLFERLYRGISSINDEGGKSSYSTTFWFPNGAAPANVAEEAIIGLQKLITPPAECIGAEWWLGRMRPGKRLNFHFDRDLALSRETGENVFPVLGSVFYVNSFPATPTVLLDQVPGPDGRSQIPAEPVLSTSVAAVKNHYVVFPGELRHGVIPDRDELKNYEESGQRIPQLRLTLLINYWHRRPSAPICLDYDGSIYSSLMDDAVAA